MRLVRKGSRRRGGDNELNFREAWLKALGGCQVKAARRLREWRENVHGGAEGGTGLLLSAVS